MCLAAAWTPMVGGAICHASVQLKNLNDHLMYIKLCDQLGRILNN
jgi:hypothetical protein